MTRGDNMWPCRHPFLTSATPRGDMWPCWHPIASIPVSRPRRRPVICGHAASLSHVRGMPPVDTRRTAFGSQCQAAHPGQSELQDWGRKGVADKSAFNYEAYRLYSVDQVLGSVQKSTGPCFVKHDGSQQLAQGDGVVRPSWLGALMLIGSMAQWREGLVAQRLNIFQLNGQHLAARQHDGSTAQQHDHLKAWPVDGSLAVNTQYTKQLDGTLCPVQKGGGGLTPAPLLAANSIPKSAILAIGCRGGIDC
jgi:hypothetical protein